MANGTNGMISITFVTDSNTIAWSFQYNDIRSICDLYGVEGVNWIRGVAALGSEEAQALLVTHVISMNG